MEPIVIRTPLRKELKLARTGLVGTVFGIGCMWLGYTNSEWTLFAAAAFIALLFGALLLLELVFSHTVLVADETGVWVHPGPLNGKRKIAWSEIRSFEKEELVFAGYRHKPKQAVPLLVIHLLEPKAPPAIHFFASLSEMPTFNARMHPDSVVQIPGDVYIPGTRIPDDIDGYVHALREYKSRVLQENKSTDLG